MVDRFLLYYPFIRAASNFSDYFARCMLMISDKIDMVLSLAYVMVDTQMI